MRRLRVGVVPLFSLVGLTRTLRSARLPGERADADEGALRDRHVAFGSAAEPPHGAQRPPDDRSPSAAKAMTWKRPSATSNAASIRRRFRAPSSAPRAPALRGQFLLGLRASERPGPEPAALAWARARAAGGAAELLRLRCESAVRCCCWRCCCCAAAAAGSGRAGACAPAVRAVVAPGAVAPAAAAGSARGIADDPGNAAGTPHQEYGETDPSRANSRHQISPFGQKVRPANGFV